jgi:hypothetical protein
LVLLLTACSSEESLLLFAPGELPADGVGLGELRADVIFRDEALADGKKVFFRTSQPLLFESREDATASDPDFRPVGATEVETSTRGGAATAYLLAATEEGTLEVEASFTTVNKDVLSDVAPVVMTKPPLIAAGSNASAQLSNVVVHFKIVCEAQNIGAFVTPRDELRVPCTVVLEDAAGVSHPHTPVRIFTEAGELEDARATDDEPRRFTYVVPPVPVDHPSDVAPWPEEDREFGAGLIPGAIEQNPRDGLATILVVARGHEAFDDDNASGDWDPGEYFIDEGEPFLDVDDDGLYDRVVDGDPCCDTNGNGQVDGPNGRWDADAWIGRTTAILWTGPLGERTAIVPASWSIPASGGKAFALEVLDDNFNPPAALGATDDFVLQLQPTTSITFDPPPAFELHRGAGLLLSPDYPLRVFGDDERRVESFLTDGVRSYGFQLRDDRAPTSSSLCRDIDWSLEVDIRHTVGLDYSGGDFGREVTTVSASGLLLAADPLPTFCP